MPPPTILEAFRLQLDNHHLPPLKIVTEKLPPLRSQQIHRTRGAHAADRTRPLSSYRS
ncbi:hypothetical protein I7I51_03297 [Histoplasma capsulatum]|uniref:Uncharacterized protein n=1 Tax=Ajellomyces capsulatus TaxID=5037 RepID=A0A8A1M630_AJECA|nr:hypothetical protein I7I51_03297 [Histoplasma capsulatum]